MAVSNILVYAVRKVKYMFDYVFILNNNFPVEPFLQSEIDSKIYQHEKLVYMPFTKNIYQKTTKNVVNVKKKTFVGRVANIIIGSLKTVFGKEIYKEVKNLKKQKRLNWSSFICLLRYSVGSESKLFWIKKYLKKNKVDKSSQILFYSYWMHQQAYVAIKLKKIYKNSLSITRCHGYDLYEYRQPCKYIPYRYFILKNMDCIYPISDDGKKYIEQQYNLNLNDKLKVMRLGTVEHGDACIDKDRHIVIVTCSDCVKVKRLSKVIDSLNDCKGKICWYHIGDGELRNSLEQQAKNLPNNIQSHFIGKIEHKKVFEFYKSHYVDAFINVSSSEGAPVAIMEALSFGIPVVATDVGGTHEIVINKYNGVLLEKDFKSLEFKMALDEIVSCPNYRTGAKRVWYDKCDADKNYKLFYNDIQQLMKG